jgi:hypothetical protein
MNLLTTVEGYAKEIGVDVETLLDADYHAFLTAATPLYNDLLAFAKAQGKADLQTFLNDLKADLLTGVTSLATSGGNVGTAIAAVSSEALGQVKDVTAAGKNALYGALAIVATDVPQIVGAPAVVSSASGTAA